MSDFREALTEAIDLADDHWALSVGGVRDQAWRDGLADAVLALLAERLGGDEVREAVANTVPLGWTDRDPYRNVTDAADAALAAVRECLGVRR